MAKINRAARGTSARQQGSVLVAKKVESLFTQKDALALASAIAISMLAAWAFSRLDFLRLMGYPGVFIISLVSSATILLPLPGFAVVFAMGAYLDPVLVGIAAGCGSAIGELSGYLAGYAGHNAVERTRLFRDHRKGVAKYGPLAIFFLAFIPNPAFDIAGIAAGAIRMPPWLFLLATAAGKTLRYIIVAYAGGAAAGFF
jgi:membrane protein YqaA with SNARE-associated domain